MHLSRFNLDDAATILDMILLLSASHNHIINVRGDVSPQLIPQYFFDHSVESASGIAQALRHSHVAVCPEGGGETGLSLVFLVHEYLVITRETIQHTEHLRASCCIDQGVDSW